MRDQVPLLADRLNRSLVPWLEQMGILAAFDVASIKAFMLKYLDANFGDWLGTVLSSARIGGTFGWEGVSLGRLETHTLPGTHFTYIRENAATAATALRAMLAQATSHSHDAQPII